MPESIRRHLPAATEETWRAVSLQRARKSAEESLTISRAISKPDTIHVARIVLARIDAVEGKSEQAIRDLMEMLESADSDSHRAELHYRVWKIASAHGDVTLEATSVTPDEHRLQSLQIYHKLLESSPTYETRVRIEEMEG